MTTSHARLSGETPPLRAAVVSRPSVVRLPAGLRRRAAPPRESAWRQARAAEALHSEEDRMRLAAALLVLATLLLWMLFLQG